jgi:hypothetical protein
MSQANLFSIPHRPPFSTHLPTLPPSFSHLRLSRIVHPDKCSHPEAATASAILNQAADTLRDPIKKRLYDAYVSDLQEVDAPEGMSYAEWEAKQADVKIPKWVEKILRMPGGKFLMLIISLLIILLILLPLIIIGVVLALVLFILCLPCNLASRMRGKTDGEAEAAAATGEQPATSAPTQQPYPTADANV